MGADARAEVVVQRPVGDLLEEILNRGAAHFPQYLTHYAGAPEGYRLAVLLGCLALGPEVVDVIRERLRRRDTGEKWSVLTGLGEIGHPEAEGYFVRVVRERAATDRCISALRFLGRIHGQRSLPTVIQALDDPFLFDAACAALAEYPGDEAITTLLPHAARLPALRALAGCGAGQAAAEFEAAIGKDPEWAAAGVLGLERLGDPARASRVVPLLAADDSALRRAAFRCYARLGMPEGAAPLADAVRRGWHEWMAEPLQGVAAPELSEVLLQLLEPQGSGGFWRRLLGRRQYAGVDRRLVARCLRGARDPGVLERIGVLLGEEDDPVVVRALLSVSALCEVGRQRARIYALWRSALPMVSHVAAMTLLGAPAADFLAGVLEYLGQPGLLALDDAMAGGDAEHLLRTYASDNNPSLMIGEFVDSGFIDRGHLREALRARVTTWSFPADTSPAGRFSRPGDMGIGWFLQGLVDAQPGIAGPLSRLWGLFAELDAQGDSLLDLFLSFSGGHRGGLQRSLVQGLPSALQKFIQGKGDRELAELNRIASRIPTEGPLVQPLHAMFERAQAALRAECRDMTLIVEGRQQRGDMVLIEKL